MYITPSRTVKYKEVTANVFGAKPYWGSLSRPFGPFGPFGPRFSFGHVGTTDKTARSICSSREKCLKDGFSLRKSSYMRKTSQLGQCDQSFKDRNKLSCSRVFLVTSDNF